MGWESGGGGGRVGVGFESPNPPLSTPLCDMIKQFSE